MSCVSELIRYNRPCNYSRPPPPPTVKDNSHIKSIAGGLYGHRHDPRQKVSFSRQNIPERLFI